MYIDHAVNDNFEIQDIDSYVHICMVHPKIGVWLFLHIFQEFSKSLIVVNSSIHVNPTVVAQLNFDIVKSNFRAI